MSEIVALKKARRGTRLRIGFLRLTDSAPAIVAQELTHLPKEKTAFGSGRFSAHSSAV